jgi:voltage-gated potassium channel
MRDNPQTTKDHKIGAFQIALMIFTIILLAALVVDTTAQIPKEQSNLIHMLDTFGCAVFFVDFCWRFYRAGSKGAFMRWAWIDLIACIPNLELFRYGRLVRVLRIIRLLRGVRSVQLVVGAVFHDKLRGGVVSVVFSAILLVGFCSASVLVCERQPDSNIKTAEDAVWWSMATITTVGYGDRYPVTTEGRVIGVILMVAGVSMFGCLSGLAASFFLGKRQEPVVELRDVLSRLDELSAKLDSLKNHPGAELKSDRPARI